MKIKTWLILPVDIHVLDFKEVRNISPGFFQVFTKFNRCLTQNAKVLATINMNNSIRANIKSSGLDNVFSPIKDYTELRRMAK